MDLKCLESQSAKDCLQNEQPADWFIFVATTSRMHHHDDHDKNEGMVLLCLLPQEIPPNYPSASHQQTKLNFPAFLLSFCSIVLAFFFFLLFSPCLILVVELSCSYCLLSDTTIH
jgi:hypothetical protein